MTNILIVGLGGAIGSILRYIISKLLNENISSTFSWGTFAVNIIGCFIIGAVTSYAQKHGLSGEMKLLLATGLCGGFTTFSTFSLENIQLIDSNQNLILGIYIIATLFCCLLTTYCGLKMFS